MSNYSDFFAANKTGWNKRTAVHKDSAFYDLEGFRAGKPALNSIELDEVGDVTGKSLLHLQCHFGMDTLDWARRGAKVTGLDFSENAIAIANNLAAELSPDARFVCANVYDLNQHITESFDIVFCSYGVVGWLPDLKKWAQLVAAKVQPGGFFYLAEFHPVVWMFDDNFEKIIYAYDDQGVIETELSGTYADRDAPISGKEYGWNHSLSEVINALIEAGLELTSLNEWMYSPHPCFNKVVEVSKGKWQIEGLEGKIPLVYSIKAGKPVNG